MCNYLCVCEVCKVQKHGCVIEDTYNSDGSELTICMICSAKGTEEDEKALIAEYYDSINRHQKDSYAGSDEYYYRLEEAYDEADIYDD